MAVGVVAYPETDFLDLIPEVEEICPSCGGHDPSYFVRFYIVYAEDHAYGCRGFTWSDECAYTCPEIREDHIYDMVYCTNDDFHERGYDAEFVEVKCHIETVPSSMMSRLNPT